MDDALLMAVDQGIEERRNDVACLRLCKSLTLENLVEELAALHELHNQEKVLIVFVNVE